MAQSPQMPFTTIEADIQELLETVKSINEDVTSIKETLSNSSLLAGPEVTTFHPYQDEIFKGLGLEPTDTTNHILEKVCEKYDIRNSHRCQLWIEHRESGESRRSSVLLTPVDEPLDLFYELEWREREPAFLLKRVLFDDDDWHMARIIPFKSRRSGRLVKELVPVLSEWDE